MIELKNFQNAIKRTPELARQIPQPTLWRYTNGKLPKAIQYLLQHPDLLRALAADADAALTTNKAA